MRFKQQKALGSYPEHRILKVLLFLAQLSKYFKTSFGGKIRSRTLDKGRNSSQSILVDWAGKMCKTQTCFLVENLRL